MAKELIAHKLIINYDKHGKYETGIIQYRTKENGQYSKDYLTISIDDAGFSIPQFNTILQKIVKKAKKAEGVQDDEQA